MFYFNQQGQKVKESFTPMRNTASTDDVSSKSESSGSVLGLIMLVLLLLLLCGIAYMCKNGKKQESSISSSQTAEMKFGFRFL